MLRRLLKGLGDYYDTDPQEDADAGLKWDYIQQKSYPSRKADKRYKYPIKQ